MQATDIAPNQPKPSVFEGVTGYHWLVVLLAASGWLFDCMGQRIFVLGRESAIRELLGGSAADQTVRLWGTIATCVLMVGWATGGIIFGMMSDRYGRVKTMIAALLAYTIFSAISGLAHSVIAFLFYRLLFGLGVGGMFGAATTLLAESVPRNFRTLALGSMQALSALGNMTASALSLKIIPGQENFWGHFSGWQVLFFAGLFPVVFVVPMAVILKEPESWRKAKEDAAKGMPGKSVGWVGDLFADRRWRRNTLVGICLGLAGMVGLWGIAFFSPELITTAFKNRPLEAKEIIKPAEISAVLKSPANPAVARIRDQLPREIPGKLGESNVDPEHVAMVLAEGLNQLIQTGNVYDAEAFKGINLKKQTRNLIQLVEKKNDRSDIILLNRRLVEEVFPGAISELQKATSTAISRGTMLQDAGAVIGMFAFTFVASHLGRRRAFLFAFVVCFCTVSFVFYSLRTSADVYWMLPLMGFATLSVFAGYSIYFPELFPTRLRGTGVGFCYNTVRYLAAPFPFLLGWLSTLLPFRTVATIMSAIYLVGIGALIWAPETKGKPLPED